MQRRILVGLVFMSCSLFLVPFASRAGQLQDALEAMARGDYPSAVSALSRLGDGSGSGSLRAALLKGRAQFLAKRYRDAEKTFASVRKKAPADSRFVHKAVFGIAECHAATGRFASAEKLFAEALDGLTDAKRQERIARRFVQLGDEYLDPPEGTETPNPGRAEPFYRAALEVESEGELAEEIAIRIGRCLSKQNRFAEAATYLEGFCREHEDSPRLAEARYRAGKAYVKASNPVAARRLLRDLLADHPRSVHGPKAALLLAETYGMPKPQGGINLTQGLWALSRFIEAYPTDKKIEQARLELAMAPFEAGRHAQGEDALRAYITAGGPGENLAVARYHLGVCLSAQERFEEAAGAWRDYLKEHPSHGFWLQARKGIEDMAWRRSARAREHANRPDNEKKNWGEVAELFQAFAATYPTADRTPEALYHAALALSEQEKVGEALAILASLTGKFPTHPFAQRGWYQTGLIQEEKRGDIPKAREAYKKAAKSPNPVHEASSRLAALEIPSLVVESPPAFRSGDKVALTWHARNIETVNLRLYRIEAEDFFRDRMEMDSVTEMDIALCTPDKSWDVPVKGYARSKRITQQVGLRIEKPGLYLVHLTGGGMEATTAVLVSDLGMIMKTGQGVVFVFGQDLKRSRPMGNTRVIVVDDDRVVVEGTTGKDGVFQTVLADDLETKGELRALAIQGDHVAWTRIDDSAGQPETADDPRAFLFSDRPAYRPGDEVSLAGIVRDRWHDKGYLTFEKDSRLSLEVFSPGNTTVARAEVKLDEFGVFHHVFRLDPAAPSGHYHFTLTGHKENVFSGSFQVQDYRLPPYDMSVHFARPVVFRGEPIEGVIRVKHHGGTPAAHQQVLYRIDPADAWKQGLSDEKGQVTFSFPTRGMEDTRKIKLEAKLPRHNLLQVAHAMVAVQAYRVVLEVGQQTLFAAQPFDLNVRVFGPDGKPRGADLRLEALQRLPGTQGEKRVAEQKIRVDKSGTLRTSLTLPEAGTHILRVFGHDRAGNPVTAEVGVHTLGEREPGIFLDLDRNEYTLGSPARISLRTGMQRGLVLFTYQTDQILGYRTVQVKKGLNTFDLPLTEALSPNFLLSAAAMDEDKLYEASRSVRVTRKLSITVRADRDKYAPGDEATLTLIARDADGKPVDARLIVSVVDEALFRAFPENLPVLLDTFHLLRPEEEFQIASSNTHRFPEVEAEESQQAEVIEKEGSAAMAALSVRRKAMTEKAKDEFAVMAKVGSSVGVGGLGTRGMGSGGGGYGRASGRAANIRMGKAGILGAAPLRKYFDQTAAFFPEVQTGPDGVASVTFRLPDSITTWRATTRGVTRDTQLGEDRTQLVSTRDFWVELVAPPELEEGDRLQPVVRVFNESGKGREVDLEMTIGGRKVTRRTRVEASLAADVAFETIEVPAEGAGTWLKIDLTASSGSMLDALSKEIPVRPRGVREDVTISGHLTRSAVRQMTLPEGLADPEMTVQLDARMTHLFLLGRFDPILFGDRPEEALVALNLLDLIGPGADRTMTDLVQTRLRSALVHLTLVQKSTGGWGWTRGTVGQNLTMTAHAVRALARARRVAGRLGWNFPQAGYDRALAVLRSSLTGLPPDDFMRRTAVLYALAHEDENQIPVVQLHRLHRLRDTLPLGAQAFLGLTWVTLARPEKAAEVVEVMKPKMNLGTHATRSFSWLPEQGNEPADLARAIELLAEVRPSDPLLKSATGWLLGQGGAMGWSYPREAEAVSAALRKLLAAPNREERFRVALKVNGKPAGDLAFPIKEKDAIGRVEVDPGLLAKGENKLELAMEGSGSCFFVATLSGYRTKAPQPKEDEPITLHRNIEPVPERYRGRDIRAGFTTVTAESPTWVNEIERIPASRRVRVTLRIRRNFAARIDHCVLKDRIPPGFALVPATVTGHAAHTHAEGRHLAFFLNSNGYDLQIQYELAAVNPGTYQFPPVRLVSLANPDTRVISESKNFVIDPAGTVMKDLRTTPDELHQIGMAAAEEKEPAVVIEKLETLNREHKVRDDVAIDVLAKLLFASIERLDHDRIVKYFELAKEKNPALIIPFDKLRPVQEAYRKVEAYEAGLHLDRGVAEARFMAEVHGVGILEAEDEMAEALDLLKEQLDTYPDNRLAAESTYAFSQVVFNRADRVRSGEELEGFDRPGLIDEVISLMSLYLGRFPAHPQGPPAVYSLASALLERGRAQEAVKWLETGLARFPEDVLAPAIAYLKAFSHFKLGQYGPSLQLCRRVADDSPDEESREMARYIMAQIHHARGEMGQALAFYRQVQERFRDAYETVREAEKTLLIVPEVIEVPPGKPAVLAISVKNLGEINLRAYRVDPMQLYLLKGSLENLTDVNLAGIKPVVNRTLQMRKQVGVTHEEKHNLRLPGKGAYLLLVRGGNHLTHSLVLNGSLSTEVTEVPEEGRVRVAVRDNRGNPLVGAQVQLKGSEDDRFITGKTDLRGIFIADDIRGAVTVITKHRGSWGLYRGTQSLKGVDSGGGESPPVYRKSTAIDFGEDVIEGQLVKPAPAESQNFFQKRVRGMAVEQAQ